MCPELWYSRENGDTLWCRAEWKQVYSDPTAVEPVLGEGY